MRKNSVAKRPVTVRIARWSATHPWWAMAIWVVFVAVCSMAGGAAGNHEATQVEFGVGESGRAVKIVDSGRFDDAVVENILITSRSGQLDQGEAKAAAGQAASRLRTLREVRKVEDPIPSPDGKAMVMSVAMSGDAQTADQRVGPLLAATADVQRDHPSLLVEQVGSASIGHGVNTAVGKDFQQAEVLSLPVTLIILLVAFGAIVAAGVPVLLGLSSVGGAIGLASLTSHLIPNIPTVSSMILLIGMAVGVDYSLFYLKREREERARSGEHSQSHVAAIEIAAATSGRAVVVSGFAVIVSMAGLYLAGDTVFSSLATGAILVIAVAMLGSLTVLPALLAKLGRRIDRPRVPLLWRIANRGGQPRVWPTLLRPALRFPVLTLILATAALVALAWPALDMKIANTSDASLPRTIPVMQSYDRLTTAFPSKGTTHEVAVTAPARRAGEVHAALENLVARAQGDQLFVSGQPAQPRTSADGRVTVVNVATPYGSVSPEAKRSLQRLRKDLVPNTIGKVADAEYAVGGDVATSADYVANLKEKMPLVVGFVLLLAFIMMTVTFRSIVVGLTTIAINLLSTAASFGVLVLVFQHSWAERLLDFRSTGAIVAWMPLFLFVVLFGLSTDYHVFVVSRIREAAQRGLPTRQAVAQGIASSAGVVTSAAIVMVSVFAIFTTLSLVDVKQMGVGLAAAVLLDAVVIRALLLPSLMALLGRANWWPSRLSRRSRPAADERRPDHAGVLTAG